MSAKEDFCFVIMPFKEEMKEVYEYLIKPSVEETGIKCVRADELDGPANIVRKIVEYIYDARVIVADLTGQNANVFYELGIAHSLGNNTIVISQEDVPFDVKSYKFIKYENTAAGGRKLYKELMENVRTVEQWSKKPTNPVQDFLPDEAKKNVSAIDFEKLKAEHEAVKKQQSDTQKKLTELEKDRAQIESLKTKEKELEQMRKWFKEILPPELLQGKTDVLEAMKEIEVSVDETSNQLGEKSKKLTFKKVN